MRATTKLRQLIAGNHTVMAGGAHDAMSAQIAEQIGFKLCVVTGAGTSVSRGYPDVGLLTGEEMVANARYIAEAVEIPVIVDADNGYGNAINVRRTVRAFEQAGVAGIHIEDQTWPKRCGHMFGKTLISTEEMCAKLRAAQEAKRDPDFVVIARCDAMLVNGLDDVLERCEAYLEAGADMLFAEMREDMDETRAFAERFRDRIPLHYNHSPSPMVPKLHVSEVEAMGFKTCCFYAQPIMAAAKAIREVMTEIYETGNAKTVQDRLVPLDDLWEIGGITEVRELEKRYGS